MPKKDSSNATYTRLHRSETDRYIAGVAGGLGEYFKIDPTLIRIIFILLTVFGGSGIVIYLLLWLVLPTSSVTNKEPQENFKDNVEDIKEKARTFAQDIRINHSSSDSRTLWGVVIIIIGILFILENFGLYSFIDLGRLWPIILIIIGLAIISR